MKPCDSGPCHNGGSCTNSDTRYDFTCQCAAGWQGRQCEESMYVQEHFDYPCVFYIVSIKHCYINITNITIIHYKMIAIAN